jgi:DnaJ-class molecular chaperone
MSDSSSSSSSSSFDSPLPTNYYELLGVSKTCTADEIKKGYRSMATKWHPDRHPTDHENANTRFIKISRAYQVLSDPHQRSLYDQFGESGIDDKTSPNDEAYEQSQQIFNMFMSHPFLSGLFSGVPLNMAFSSGENGGGGGGGVSGVAFQGDFCGQDIFRARMNQKDPPIVQDLMLSLSDFYYGADKQLKITRKEYGRNNDVVNHVNHVSVPIRPGASEGTKITLENMGDIRSGHIPADLIFILKSKPLARFERQGSKLIFYQSLSLLDLLTGITVKIPRFENDALFLHCQTISAPICINKPLVIPKLGFQITDLRSPRRGQRDDLMVMWDTSSWPNHLSTDDVVPLFDAVVHFYQECEKTVEKEN